METTHKIIFGDCLEKLKQIPDESVDLVFADPPYNMSKKKGLDWKFSKHITMQETWDIFSKDEFFEFNLKWLSECFRVLKHGGSLWVSGSFHNIYQLGRNRLSKEQYDHSLNPIIAIGILAQLLIIEQEYNYNKPSNFMPPTLFFQGWVREFIDNPKEIDNLCMSVAHGQPPIARYTEQENQKNKKYVKNRKPLWYLTTP